MVSYNWDIIDTVKCNKESISTNLPFHKREFLDLNLRVSGTNRLLVIMMNPSNADDKFSDGTIDLVSKYFQFGGCTVNNDDVEVAKVKYISVVNLFPICCPKSTELNSYIDRINQCTNENLKIDEIIISNRKVIEERIIESNYVVLGWGDCPSNFHETSFHREIVNVIDLLKAYQKTQVYIFHIRNKRAKARGVSSENILTNRKNPVHPSNGDIINLLRVQIDDLYRIIPC
jgi:Protein of unknown function (DUF1643).